jgi:hypothetical protein
MATSTIGSAWGQLGALAAQPGQIFATNGTDGIYAYDNYTQQQQMNSWTTTVGSTSATISLGALGQWQQALEPAKKKAMSLLESLRDEVGKWHGSLGVL